MPARPARSLRPVLAGLVALLLFVGVLATGAVTAPARADSAPSDPSSPATPVTATADALPTVQIDGVVWSQVVVGNTVYVTGKFTNARPAGAAAGTNLTPRSNLLAYDIRTGALITSFAPKLNAQGLVVTASPDGSRIYVGGDFTTVDGVTRNRIVAISTATGAVISSFAPSFSSTVRAIVATNSTVYVGGSFKSVGTTSRSQLAALNASDGRLLNWAPVAGAGTNSNGSTAVNATVNAMVMTSADQIVVGGRFGYLNGTATSGVGAVDATTGANRTFEVGQLITNQGDDSAITSLSSQGGTVWMSGYDFYGPGNLEGTLSATADGGRLVWEADCHGDTYSNHPSGGVVYTAGHPHQCQNIGGFPERDPRISQYAIALTKATTGTVLGGSFFGTFNGAPAPTVAHWYPTFQAGDYTKQYQAGWSVTGNDQYVVYGGEFPRVNGVAQQGLVRFAAPSVAPNTVGPKAGAGFATPTVTPMDSSALRVSWTTAYDMDNENLTYAVYRDGNTTTPVYRATERSVFYDVHRMGWTDTSIAAGTTHRYQVTASDPAGNTVRGSWVTATAKAAAPYTAAVVADRPTSYWPLSGLTGSTVTDLAGRDDLTTRTGFTGTTSGPAAGLGAVAVDGTNVMTVTNGTVPGGRATSSASPAVGAVPRQAPDVYSLELWFNTTSTDGGRLAGFGNDSWGANGSYDRMVYMDRQGRLVYGVYNGNVQTVTTAAGLNDGTWHHVVAELSPAGQTLYVDGLRVGTNPGVTAGQSYRGWWQLGGGSLGGWPGDRATEDWSGQLAQVAVYPTALSRDAVRAHYVAAGRTVATPSSPADAYGAAVFADAPSFQWRLQDQNGSTTAANSADSGYVGSVQGQVAAQQPGVPMPGVSDPRGVGLNGSGSFIAGTQPVTNPTTFSVETWFNTTSRDGGRLIGFGSDAQGYSGSYDRMVYMFADGRLRFGVWTGREQVIDSPTAYNDGAWHHIVATMGPAGMTMYVDGISVGTNPNSSVVPYDGFWRLGSDNQWGGSNTSSFTGTLDEAAVYPTQLTQDQVRTHYRASGRTVAIPTRPADAYGAAVYDSGPSLYWRMGDTSGTTAAAAGPAGGAGTYYGNPTLGAAGPQLAGVPDNRAVGFDGVDDGIASVLPVRNPGTFTEEFWFSSTTTVGGKLMGFGDRQSGYSNNYDRHVYLEPDGRLTFGAWTGVANTVQTARPYNDGRWHHVVATLGADGMWLYVDGVAMGSYPNSGAQGYDGFWRVGGDTPWSGSGYAAASIDEVSVYDRVLSSQEVMAHYTAATGPIDTAPTAAFTTTASGLSVSFDGSTSTDAEGAIRNWAWDFGDGSTGTGATVGHDYASTGTRQVTLTVTDSGGQTATTTIAVTVTAPPPNQAPTADFTAATDDLQVVLDGRASRDADGSVASYAWDFGDGSTATGAQTSHVYATAGTRTVSLTVTDNAGASSTERRQVTTTAPNQPPVAAFTRSAADLVLSVDGRGSSDPDGQVRTWSWSFGDGSTATGAQATHTYAAAGTYPVSLTVTDDRGAQVTTTSSVTLTVTPPPNVAPVAAFTSTVTDLSVALDGRTSTDSDGSIAGWAWDFGDGKTATGATTTHAYATAGSFVVTLTVTDDRGATATTKSTVTTTLPANVAPTAAFTSRVSGRTVALDGTGSRDTDGRVTGWAWDFGNGTTGTGATPSVTYAGPGTYPVTLTVTDDRGGSASTSASVVISAAPLASDSFTREVTAGWGQATSGGTWATTGTASVTGGAGVLTAAAGRSATATLGGLSTTDVAVQANLVMPAAPTGGGTYVSLATQRNGGSDYRVKVLYRANGTVSLILSRTVSDAETTLGSVTLPGTVPAGTALTVRFETSAAGSATTTLRARAWVAGTAQPTTWNVQASDTTVTLQRAGAVSVQSYVSGTATSAASVRVDDLWVGAAGTAPQG